MRSSRLRLFLVALIAMLPALAVGAMTAEERQRILAPTTDFGRAEPWESLPGGSATNRRRFGRDAFSQPSASLSFADRADFFVGNGLFKRVWVIAPSSTQAADGLGPFYNARACQRCHLKDGRGHPPEGPDDSAVSMFLRLSVPPQSEEDRARLASHRAAVIPEPTYGGQLQDFAIAGHAAEGRMVIRYRDVPVRFADGETVTLRAPSYEIADLGYGPLHPETLVSPRVAPVMIGLGLLEAVAEADILAAADPDDADGDGLSGKPNWVWSDRDQAVQLGRFGWKAGKSTIADQSAGAFGGDIGISTPLAPASYGDCTASQEECRAAPHGGSPAFDGLEADAEMLDLVVFYSQNLAVPARRRADDPTVLRGKSLFYGAGCIACHTPKHATRSDWPVSALAGQLIWPYTDLLLHDMGEGLADGRPEGEADGREWRTAPLWGIGFTEPVSGHSYFLHDGRARTLTEAILWHGGEAEAAKERFRTMPKPDREALLAFLQSL